MNMTWMDCLLPRPCKLDPFAKIIGATTERLLVPTPNAHPSMSNLNQRKNPRKNWRNKSENEGKKKNNARKKMAAWIVSYIPCHLPTKGMLFATPREAVFVFSLGFTRNLIFHKDGHQGDKCMNMDDCGWFLVMMERAQVIFTNTLLWQFSFTSLLYHACKTIDPHTIRIYSIEYTWNIIYCSLPLDNVF